MGYGTKVTVKVCRSCVKQKVHTALRKPIELNLLYLKIVIQKYTYISQYIAKQSL